MIQILYQSDLTCNHTIPSIKSSIVPGKPRSPFDRHRRPKETDLKNAPPSTVLMHFCSPMAVRTNSCFQVLIISIQMLSTFDKSQPHSGTTCSLWRLTWPMLPRQMCSCNLVPHSSVAIRTHFCDRPPITAITSLRAFVRRAPVAPWQHKVLIVINNSTLDERTNTADYSFKRIIGVLHANDN